MKKKIIFIIFVVLISLVNVKAESTPQRGDLRCPQHLESNVKCYEIKNESGVVTRVDLVYGSLVNDGDIQITKTVTKKLNELGHYYVQFNVKGKNVSQKKTFGKASLVIIIDSSKTISGRFGSVKNAVKNFVNELKNRSPNYAIKVVQFATGKRVAKKWTDEEITWCSPNTCGMGTQSHLEKTLTKDVLNFPADSEKKYVLLYGDGEYWSTSFTGVQAVCDNRKKKFLNDVKFFTIRFPAADDSTSDIVKFPRSGTSCTFGGLNEPTNTEAHKQIMKWLASPGCVKKNGEEGKCKWEHNSKNNLEVLLKNVSDIIESETESSNSSFASDLTDNIGDDFYLTDDMGNYQKFNVGKLTEEGQTLPSTCTGKTEPCGFEIEIDQYVKGDEPNGGGWHETNKNFTFSYTDESGVEHKIPVNDNPEVYWIPYDLYLHTCHGSSIAGTIRKDESDAYQYFKRSCREGYMEDGVNKNGFTTEAIINELDEGVRSFNILSGLGFPSELKMSTNVVCTYQFDADAYNARYNQLQNAITQLPNIIGQLENKLGDASLGLTDEEKNEIAEEIEADRKELASAQKEVDNMIQIYNSYVSYNSEEDLREYADRFKAQKAALTVHYYDAELEADEFDYANIEETVDVDNIKCEVRKTGNVAGKETVIDRKCTASFKKDMQIEGSCLNMQTGNPEECKDSVKNQIVGGPKVYTNLKSKGGYITIKIPDAGYKGNLDIELTRNNPDDGKEECSFAPDGTNTFGNIEYRQIQLEDPFLKSYNPSRGVGKNYLGDKFDFQAIIHGDTWSSENESEYDYLMSKTNISNIRRDTREEKNKAYLGRSCYFTKKSKYQCDFTRNKTENSASNGELWFSGVKIK